MRSAPCSCLTSHTAIQLSQTKIMVNCDRSRFLVSCDRDIMYPLIRLKTESEKVLLVLLD